MSDVVRPARPGDAAALAALRYEFRASIGRAIESEGQFLARCVPWMRQRLRPRGGWRCWVAEPDGRIEGHLWAHLLEKVPNPTPEAERHAYLTNLYVREAARGRGLGARLLEAALAWCRDEGVDSAFLWATDESRSLYLRHGFQPPDEVLELVLHPGRSLAHRRTPRGRRSE